MAITPMKIRPVMSIPVMTFLPSVAASSTASHAIADSIGKTLTQSLAVSRQRRVDGRVAGIRACEPLERPRIVVETQRRARVVELAATKPRRRRGPDGAVARDLLCAQIRAQGDQLGQVVDSLDGAALLDADEAVRVQVVAEQERGVTVLRREQARAAVVQDIALV